MGSLRIAEARTGISGQAQAAAPPTGLGFVMGRAGAGAMGRRGFSTGGEYAGATTYIAEYAPDTRRGFLGSWLDFGTFVGYALGSGLVTLLTAALGDDGLVDWGWRLPFLVAGSLGLIGLYTRLRLEETPAFQREAEQAHRDAEDARAAGGADPVEYRSGAPGPGHLDPAAAPLGAALRPAEGRSTERPRARSGSPGPWCPRPPRLTDAGARSDSPGPPCPLPPRLTRAAQAP
ncbi:hypothetical protein Spla01_00715 [Streptomyces platensis]|uniref:Proline/betaine transporter n=1 Tax=Streptomyces platensis TaxID=58346 RepID=A0ABX3XRW4_STRPT|nr:Proline/betaine transporter [Streptomyces platensis]